MKTKMNTKTETTTVKQPRNCEWCGNPLDLHTPEVLAQHNRFLAKPNAPATRGGMTPADHGFAAGRRDNAMAAKPEASREYERLRMRANEMLEELRCRIAVNAERQTAEPKNWEFPGSMEHLNAKLSDLLEFFSADGQRTYTAFDSKGRKMKVTVPGNDSEVR